MGIVHRCLVNGLVTFSSNFGGTFNVTVDAIALSICCRCPCHWRRHWQHSRSAASLALNINIAYDACFAVRTQCHTHLIRSTTKRKPNHKPNLTSKPMYRCVTSPPPPKTTFSLHAAFPPHRLLLPVAAHLA